MKAANAILVAGSLGVVLLTGAFLGSCAAPTPAEREARQIQDLAKDVNDELSVGKEISARLLGRFPPDKSRPALREYVNLVGQLLAHQSGRPELTYRFEIVQDGEPNAFAAPGGYIFVTTSLLKLLRNESELAGVLAHEIAHVNEKHMYKEIAPKKEQDSTATMVNLISRGRSDMGASFSRIVTAGMKMLLDQGLGHEKEIAADEAGALYVAAAGYDPLALGQLLERIQKATAAIANGRVARTHPPFPRRIQGLTEFLRKNGLSSQQFRANAQVLDTRFKGATKGL